MVVLLTLLMTIIVVNELRYHLKNLYWKIHKIMKKNMELYFPFFDVSLVIYWIITRGALWFSKMFLRYFKFCEMIFNPKNLNCMMSVFLNKILLQKSYKFSWNNNYLNEISKYNDYEILVLDLFLTKYKTWN